LFTKAHDDETAAAANHQKIISFQAALAQTVTMLVPQLLVPDVPTKLCAHPHPRDKIQVPTKQQ
jgi:hypothetical protein